MSLRRALVFGAIAAAVLAAASAPVSSSTVGNCKPGKHWGTLHAGLANGVMRLVNVHRKTLGLKVLRTSTRLRASARWKSLHMARYHYLSHNDPAPPVRRGAFQRFAACGYPWAPAGENIAEGYPTAAAVVAGWLASPGHRRNIENGAYRFTGIAAATRGKGPVYWTQEFGGK